MECINKTWSVTKKKRANYEGSNRRNKGRKGWVAIIWVSSDSIFFPPFLPLSFSLSPSSFSRVFCSFSGMHFKSERNSQTCFPIHHSGVCPAPDPGNSLSNLNALQRQRVSSIGGVRGGVRQTLCPSNLIANSRAIDNFYCPRHPFQAKPANTSTTHLRRFCVRQSPVRPALMWVDRHAGGRLGSRRRHN